MKNLARWIRILLLSSMVSVPKADASIYIDMHVLAEIESSNNPKAFNKKTKARGLFQITPICLKDYNIQMNKSLKITDMYDPEKCRTVADWYLSERIPQMIHGIKRPITVQTILWVWNAGIVALIRDRMPKETRDLINKYNRLTNNN